MKSSNHLSLFEVSLKIQDSLERSFPTRVWIVAEISELKENRSGHCYIELIEKDDESDQIKAKARAIIWSWSYRMIKPFFETSTNRSLSAGIKVLVLCDIKYHPLYGLSLSIQDIDPTYTIGDVEQQRKIIISRLISDGIFDMNREIGFPLLPKRVAVISSPTAAGYQDFSHQIENNADRYQIIFKLFPAIMQGEKAEDSIIEALNLIHNSIETWDVVAIIRGGGSQVDLGCFDSYLLASNVAQFPLPVITGIGHEKDVTITDMVAYNRLKTPTAVAEFLLDQFSNAENWIIEAMDNFSEAALEAIRTRKDNINRLQNKIVPLAIRLTNNQTIKLQRELMISKDKASRYLSKRSYELDERLNVMGIRLSSIIDKNKVHLSLLSKSYRLRTKKNLLNANDRITQLEKNIESLNPVTILKRGYSITLMDGKTIKSSNELQIGNKIETLFAKGSIESVVKSIK